MSAVLVPARLRPPVRPGLVRVAHVVLNLQVGGMEKLLVELARHADRGRFEVRFLSLQARGPLAEEIEACGAAVACLDAATGLQPGLTARLERCFRRDSIDVVHVHNHPALIYAAPAARLAGVPVVVQTRHGQGIRVSRRQRWLVRALSLLVDQVVCVSDDAAAVAAREGIPRHKLMRLWNGIDLERFRFSGPCEDGPIVMVARLSQEKSAETLIQAAGLLRAEFPDLRVEIAGDGPCRAECQHWIDQLDLADRVTLLGVVRDVPALLGRARLFVLPSRSEGVSLTVLEAMARGLPVVATRVGGNPEVVLDGQTGLLTPPDEPGLLAERIALLLRDPARGRQMGLAGRERVEMHFNAARMTQSYEQLYCRLLQRRREGRG